jgi:hypothetical protein
MAYDEGNQTAVLFGGQGLSSYLNDTWTWNGASWTEQHPPLSPPARFGAAMAYDATRKVVVLFGGMGDLSSFQIGALGDTWTWNGTTWTEQHPMVSPSPRRGASLAFDATSGQVVLFGGDAAHRVPLFLNETWLWNGTTWTQRNPASSPAGRVGAILAYDDAASQLVLFGGANGMLGDTWIWDGRTWIQGEPSLSPSPRYDASAAYSSSDGELLLFGGWSGYSGWRLDETWAWNAQTWRQLHPSNPSARMAASMSRGPSGSVVLFGGSGLAPKGVHGELNDTWIWHDADWTPARR